MRRFFSVTALAVVVMLGLAGCQPKERKVYVASINDMHANIDNFPKLASLVDSLRAVHPDMFLFSAGDNRSGNPINDRYAEPARPMVDLMNAVGFDLSIFGNHEWDAGVLALRDVMSVAKYPYVCANVTFDDSLKMNCKPYVIFERNGLKIGVIGAIQLGMNGIPDFHPKNSQGSHFRPAAEVIPEYLSLRDECDALFLVSHCGFEEDVELANQFPQFDAIFGGHSHTLVNDNTIVNGVLITQAMNRIKYLTFSTFTFDKKGKLIAKESVNLPIAAEPRNAKIQAMVDEFNSNDAFSAVMGYNDEAIVDCHECLGNLMADAAREGTGAQMAFQNHGGVRFDTLSVRPITLKDLFSLDPFDNELIQFDMTGQEIVDFLAVSMFTDNGPNLCSGCTYSFSEDDEGQMKDCKVILDNGKPLDMNEHYKVTMNSYMSSAFDFEHEDPGTSTFRTSNEVLVEYLAAHPHINYAKALRLTIK